MENLLRPDWFERLVLAAVVYYVVITSVLGYIVWKIFKKLKK